jgi:RNA polymerase sigma factor (sigma-70 family)
MKVDLFTEEEILKGCIKNERKYQEILYRKYAKQMYGICLSYAGNIDMAEDMLQDSFIKIFDKIIDYKPTGSLEGWIRRVVSNTAIDHLRSAKRIQNFISENEVVMDGSISLSGFENLKTQDILQQVGLLPDGARLVFNLYAIEGYTHKEIAQKLNISEGTSKSQFNRARKLLMSWLNKLSA